MSRRSAQVANWLRGLGRAARRPGDADARQQVALWEVDARRDEARRGHHPRHRRCCSPPTCPTGSRAATSRHVIARSGAGHEVRAACRATGRRIAVGAPARYSAWHRRTPDRSRICRTRSSPRTASRAPATRCCSTSPRGPPRAEAGRAHAASLPGRAPVDHVLDRHPARRRAPEHLLAGLGQARLVATCSRRGTRRRTVLILNYVAVRRRRAARRARRLRRHARSARRPTVWRMLIQADLSVGRHHRTARVRRRRASRSTRRSSSRSAGRGASPSGTASARPRRPRQVGNPPGQPLKPGRWAARCPATRSCCVDPVTGEPAGSTEGEICLDLSRRPLGLMTGYADDDERERARRCAAATTTPATSPPATTTATSPTSAATDDVFKASRLPDLAVRARIGADGAPGGRRGRRRPLPRPAAAGRAQGVRRCWPAGAQPSAELARRHHGLRPRAASAATSGSAGWSSATCPRRSPARSAGWSCARRRTIRASPVAPWNSGKRTSTGKAVSW